MNGGMKKYLRKFYLLLKKSYKMTNRKLCPNKQENLKICPCDWPDCPRKGFCCECVRHHKESGDLPACLR